MSLPISLNVKNRNVLVVGAGRVATHKVEVLAKEGANVSVVSLKVDENFKKKNNLISIKERAFESQDVEGAFLVVAATHDQEVNQKVKQECEKRHILFSCVQSEVGSDFVLSAPLRRGELMVAVSTEGGVPGLSKTIRNYLDGILSEDWELFLNEVIEHRKKAKEITDPEKRRKLIFKLSDQEIVTCLQEQGIEKTRELIDERLAHYA